MSEITASASASQLPWQTVTSHGGDVQTFRERFGGEPLDFSANVSALGMSPAARAAARDALDQADRYPDPACRELRRAIAAHEDVPFESVLCGNGAADVIWRLVLALRPRRALLCAPTFSEYEAALRAVDCEVVRHELRREGDFALGGDFALRVMTERPDVVFLCEPNNPTGLVSPRDLLLEVLAACDALGALLVVDECFNGFLPDPSAHTLVPLVAGGDCPRLFVLKAFTKLYGMAGLRLGYGLCSDATLLARMRDAGQAWPVSSVAQAAGIAALGDVDYVAAVRDLVASERPYLSEGLRRLGLYVVPGQANYLFFESDVLDLVDRVARLGVIMRDCANYPGLRPGDVRVAVRTRKENDRLLDALARALHAADEDGDADE